MAVPPIVPSPFFSLPGLFFESVVRTRNALYSAGWLPASRLERPVISIGNLHLGGTGKTPLVVYVAELLRKLNATPALLSRGYGRLGSAMHVLPPGEFVPDAGLVLGDEPALVQRRIPEIWLGISKDRYGAGQKILARKANPVFILDDGFQHRRLHRDLDLVVIDRTQPFAGNRVFPKGTLREPLEGLRRADVILINGPSGGDNLDPVEGEIRKIHPTANIFCCFQKIDSLVPLARWLNCEATTVDVQQLHSVFLVAALGNPERFRSDVQSLGVSVKGARFLRDHRALTSSDWRECIDEARRTRADVLITTEKDAVKLSDNPNFPVLVSVQSTHLTEPDRFKDIVKATIEDAP